jgi:hypothetical protein
MRYASNTGKVGQKSKGFRLANLDKIFDLCVWQVMEGEAPADYPAD